MNKIEITGMQRIAVDMDGVLSDTVEQFISWEEKETGRRKSMEEIIGNLKSRHFQTPENMCSHPTFFVLPVL